MSPNAASINSSTMDFESHWRNTKLSPSLDDSNFTRPCKLPGHRHSALLDNVSVMNS